MYLLLLLFIIGIIYLIQNKNKNKDILQYQIEQEKKQQLELLLKQLQKKEEPIDCIGEFNNWSECNVKHCDISNNINGIGTKTRKYIINVVPKNGGKICPSNETTDCIKEDYEFCKECKGRWGIVSDCQKITRCEGTIGKGEKSQNYITTDPLINCILPRTLKIDCSVINYPTCTCSYDISSNINCNDNNTICEGGVSKCILDYTKTPEITGGVCPNPNNIYKEIGDSRCFCTVEKTFGNWNYTNEKCNSTTYSADRSRIITITKTGGLKGCTFIKEQNEDSENRFKNPNGNFQFSTDNDYIDASFNITQTEKINWLNNDKCICEGTTWVDYTTCPSRKDYSIPDYNFFKVQKRTTTKTIPGITCDSRNVLCPRDCSGNWSDWSICNNQGKKTRTLTTTFEQLNNGICITEQTEDCPFDCVGEFDNWSECNVTYCDISNNKNGIGTKTREYIIREYPQNLGKPCPPTDITSCVKEDYEFCKVCKGRWGIESDCQNVTVCDKTVGKGVKSQNYISTYPLSNCILPKTQKIDCEVINYPLCTCSYDISSNENCNNNNTTCEGGVSKCILDYTKTPEIIGGVCPSPNNIYEKIGDSRCFCTVKRTYSNWKYTNESCNSTTYSAVRSRIITVKKTGGFKGCTFLKEHNEDPENKFKNPNGNFQFSSDNDKIDASFNITQTENIQWPNNDNCICEGTTWIDDTICPSRTDYRTLESDFYKVQKRTTVKLTPGITCASQNVSCPRDCSGNWNNWSICNNQGKKIRTFRTLFKKLNNGTDCPSQEIENCPFDCVGEFDNWSECNVTYCDVSNNINGIGTKTREYIIREYPQNLGKACPPTDKTSCTEENYKFCRECEGHWGIESDCQNVTVCRGSIGKGVKSQNYISTYPLANCILPRTRKIDCEVINYPTCICSYDISSNINCNYDNTVCKGGVSECTLDYTKTPEITGGICPAPNNIHREFDDQRCHCIVERNFGDWKYNNEICNTTTYTADRSRIIKVKKKGGLRGCTFIKEENEDSDRIYKNPNGDFQFNSSDDKIDASFNITQTEKVISFNDYRCSDDCYGYWEVVSPCNAICDGVNTSVTGNITKSYNIIKQAINNGKKCSIPDYTIITETCSKSCSVDCSGNWGNWSSCVANCNDINTTANGYRTRFYNITRPARNGGSYCSFADNTKDIETCIKTDCSVNCAGSWGNWSSCNPNCNDVNTFVYGNRTRTYTRTRNAQNGGFCPSLFETQLCTKKNCNSLKTYRIYTGVDSYLLTENNIIVNCSLINNIQSPINKNNIIQITTSKTKETINTASKIFSLFLSSDGEVFSRGNNEFGQLGIGNNNNQTTLQKVIGATNIIQISAGENHSLFLKNDGTVWGCGNNLYGQLGIGTTNNQNTLQQVKGFNGVGFITDITQISAGGNYSLFLKNDGAVFACGSNDYGQLGINEMYFYTDDFIISYVNKLSQSGVYSIIDTFRRVVQTLQQVKGINDVGILNNITQISAGYDHSLFLNINGLVYSCGRNSNGQLGIGQFILGSYTIIQVINATNIIKISAGGEHSLFLKNDGTVLSCGANYNAQLGISNKLYGRISTIDQVKDIDDNRILTDIVEISAGMDHSLFLNNKGKVFSCGDNKIGQLCIIDKDNQTILQQV